MSYSARFQPVWTVSVLPPNATPWERTLEATLANVVAWDPVDAIPAARSAVESPLTLLPYLAMERVVEEWDSIWSEAQRRAAVAGSFIYHQHKGTRRALSLALEPLGFATSVIEWFEPVTRRPAYTFQLQVALGTDVPFLAANRGQIVRVANQAKNAHTMLEVMQVTRQAAPAVVYAGGLPFRRRTIYIGQQPRVTAFHRTGYVYAGGAPWRRRTLRVAARSS